MIRPGHPVYTRPFLLAATANFLFFSNMNAYTLLPLRIQQLGGREGQIGSIMAMYTLAAICCQPAIGPLVDRFGRRALLLAGGVAATAAAAAFWFGEGLGWHFYLLRFIQGMAFACFITSNLTLLADLVPPARRAEAVGIFGVSGLVTIALAPAVGEFILGLWGFPTFFLVTVLLGLGVVGMVLAMPVPPSAPVEGAHRLGVEFWRTFVPVLVAAFQFGLANSIVFVFLPPFAKAIGLPRVGPFYIVYSLMAVAVRLFGGRVADRLERRQVILPSLAALSIGVLIFAGLQSMWVLVLVALVNGTAHGFVFPAASALAFDRAPSQARGRALAAFNTASLVGGALGALGFGWLAEHIGYRPSFVLLGLLLSAGTVVFWRRR